MHEFFPSNFFFISPWIYCVNRIALVIFPSTFNWHSKLQKRFAAFRNFHSFLPYFLLPKHNPFINLKIAEYLIFTWIVGANNLSLPIFCDVHRRNNKNDEMKLHKLYVLCSVQHQFFIEMAFFLSLSPLLKIHKLNWTEQ